MTTPSPYLSAADIHLLVTDGNLNIVGDPIYCWETLDCTLRHNAAGSGQFTTPAYDWIRDQIQPGNRIVVIRNGEIFMAGPWESRMREQSDDGDNAGVGVLTVDFTDDLGTVVTRLAMPDPAVTPEDQLVDYWTYSGNAEVVLRSLVDANCGPGARTARRIPQLELGTLQGVGGTVTGQLRLEQLGDALRTIAQAGGKLGFRTRHDMTLNKILFEVFAPRDLSNVVRFSFGLGNMRYLALDEQAPTATTAVVGGQGEGADRYMIGRTRTDAETVWGRSETYVARPGNDPLESLQEDGDQALSEAAPTVRLQSNTYDTPDQRFGVHYGLGDKVSIEVAPGEQVSDLVRLVHLQAWATAGELVSAMVGTQDASSDPKWVYQLRQMDRRVGRLERRTLPSA